jgi:type II secretory pathway pseudopilin PulG
MRAIRLKARQAMSLVEVIGVLAILAIVVSLLLPRIQRAFGNKNAGAREAINNAQIEEVLFNLHAIKSAVMQHQARFGSLASLNGSPLAVSGSDDNYDRVLLTEGLIDKPFAVRMGTRASIRLLSVSTLSASSSVTGSNGAYDLSGSGHNEIVRASHLVEAVIEGVNAADARALKDRLDGPATGSSPGSDLKGRVIVRRSHPGSVELHIYLTHQ